MLDGYIVVLIFEYDEIECELGKIAGKVVIMYEILVKFECGMAHRWPEFIFVKVILVQNRVSSWLK